MAATAELVAMRALTLAWFYAPLPVAIFWLTAHLPAAAWSATVRFWCELLGLLTFPGQLVGCAALLIAILRWPGAVRHAAGRILIAYYLILGVWLVGATLDWLRLITLDSKTVDLLVKSSMWGATALAAAFPVARWRRLGCKNIRGTPSHAA